MTPGARIPQRTTGPPRSGVWVGSGSADGSVLTGRRYLLALPVGPLQQLLDRVRGHDPLGGDAVLLRALGAVVQQAELSRRMRIAVDREQAAHVEGELDQVVG